MIMISYSLIAACCFVCLLQPRRERFLVSGIFCGVSILPEIGKIYGLEGIGYIGVCALLAIAGCIFISKIMPRTLYALSIMVLFCLEIGLNIFGAVDWFAHISINFSNYLVDITNYSLAYSHGEMYIYEALAVAYNLLALLTLLDRKGIPLARDSFAVNAFCDVSGIGSSHKGGS